MLDLVGPPKSVAWLGPWDLAIVAIPLEKLVEQSNRLQFLPRRGGRFVTTKCAFLSLTMRQYRFDGCLSSELLSYIIVQKMFCH